MKLSLLLASEAGDGLAWLPDAAECFKVQLQFDLLHVGDTRQTCILGLLVIIERDMIAWGGRGIA